MSLSFGKFNKVMRGGKVLPGGSGRQEINHNSRLSNHELFFRSGWRGITFPPAGGSLASGFLFHNFF